MNIVKSTMFSPDRVYRYTLWRDWWKSGDKGGFVMMIGLNPSTADETKDDPTIRRCIDFTKRWGYSTFCMTNLFAFRATDPEVMKAAKEPVGELNDSTLTTYGKGADIVVAAWGVHGTHLYRNVHVKRMMRDAGVKLKCFRRTKDGHPAHPLYMPSGIGIIDF